jgi:hypothetical protein
MLSLTSAGRLHMLLALYTLLVSFQLQKLALTHGLSRLGGRRRLAHYHTDLQSRMSLLYQCCFLVLNHTFP